MNARLRPVLAVGAVVLCALAVTTACSGGTKKVSKTVTSSSSATTPAPATTTTTKPAPKPKPKPAVKAVNPLTGGKPVAGPVIAVKIDDTGLRDGRSSTSTRPTSSTWRRSRAVWTG